MSRTGRPSAKRNVVAQARSGRASGRRRWVVLAAFGMLVAVLLLVFVATRGGSEGASDRKPAAGTVTPLTDEQAGRLSQVLSKNYEGKGARFTVAAPVSAGMTLRLAGEVDWVRHLGHAAVTWEGNPAPGRVVEVYWSESEVLEHLPGLDTALTAAGKRPATWTSRPVDTKANALDRVIELVTKLASQQRDNPTLLQQHAGTGWLRTDTLRATAVDVFAYSAQVRHWVGVDDGRLLRVEADIGGFPQATVVDLLAVGAQTVRGPRTSDVVAIDQVKEVYERLNPAPR